jgi:catechol 2,3-dioxygenase-like lactoylglutathione lyase family enzyme
METTILYAHISLNVTDVSRSVAFYKTFFGAAPAKERPGYAKFQLENPKLNFSLNENPQQLSAHGALNHLGFQVATTDEVLMVRLRLKQAGLATQDEMQTTCCYAVQDKIWVQDPDGNNWEVFTVLAEASEYRSGEQENALCCAPELVSLEVVN